MSSRTLEPLTVSAVEAAALIGVSKSTWYAWTDAGRTPAPLKVGGRTLWRFDELQAWIDAGAPPRERWNQMRGAR